MNSQKKTSRARKVSEFEKTLLYSLDIVSDGIWDWNIRTDEVNRSAGWYRMLGYPLDSLPRTVETWHQLIHPEDKPRVVEIFNAYMQGKSQIYEANYRVRKMDGSYLWIRDRGKHVEFDRSGEPVRMMGAHTDIDEMRRASEALEKKSADLAILNAKLEQLVAERTRDLCISNERLSREIDEVTRLSQTDDLTGIFNRRRFQDLFQQEIRRIQRIQSPICLMILDVDNFKQVNDNYGHQVGDRVLVRLSRTINEILRDSDAFGRWGGEEFIIMMPDSTLEHGELLAERIRKQVSSANYPHGEKLTVSIGLAQYRNGEDPEDLISRADTCMYRSKEIKNTITCEQ